MTEFFENQYYSEWVLTEQDVKLQELAQEYHERCEAYDRTVCTGPIRHGSILPGCNSEFILINKNAGKVIKDICDRNQQFTRQQIFKAISKEENK